ncbi:MATE family efflux transporter [Haloplanus aerogenes]|uniref:Multidrug-efflux transporter n=1 Tax=Haloplanus aerogenes TaxID=660522 RepID=A0A3M0E7Z4_9EURY|nr:MATE family efflux transporter [Haloplanus aerogenes]AZH24352.1 MATE family efflux transporter [Haloplanus aerogenes]RMB24013.1 putative MATE family efflux protein [Haloplanus aerogenes]
MGSAAFDALAGLLDRAGVIDRLRFRETFDLSWPRIVTGLAIMSKSTVDLAMVGWDVGTAAVAGLAFANAYWQVGKFLGIGLAGGTVSLVSQAYGAENPERASAAVAVSLVVTLLIAAPLATAYALFAPELVAVLGSEPEPLRHAATYLALVAPALLFEFPNLIASRTYAGVGDTVTPMLIRAGGALMNIGFSAVLIFGYGLGVAGAAIGTSLATGVVVLVFVWGLAGRTYFGRGACPIAVSRATLAFDGFLPLTRRLLVVSAPLMARRTAEMLVAFPLVAIAATFGPAVVAAYEVARRVRTLIDSFSWGFSIAASTLVGQRLGAGDEADAEAYARAIIRLSATVYVVAAVVVFALSPWIAGVFVDDPAVVDIAAPFVAAAAVSVVFLGIDGSATGTLRGAGDTQYPFFTSLLGRYGCALPVAALGLVTTLGATALLVALVAETVVPAILNVRRVRSNRWKAVGRAHVAAGD